MTEPSFEVTTHRFGHETARYEEPADSSGNGHDTSGSGTEDTHLEWTSEGYSEWTIIMKNQSASVGATIRVYVANEASPGNNDWANVATITLSAGENQVKRITGEYTKMKITAESAGAAVSEHMKYDLLGV